MAFNLKTGNTRTSTKKLPISPANPDTDLSDISLYTLNQYFEGPKILNRVTGQYEVRPIEGNESIRVMALLGWYVKKLFILLEGESGSAKSEIQNAIIVLMFGDDGLDGDNEQLYFIDSGSDMVQFRKEEEIKKTSHAFIPELQNAFNYFDMLKKWAEGKVFKREVLEGRTPRIYKVPPRPVISCLALNNDKIKELPSEVIRRFLILFTITSKNINEKVHRKKGEIRALPNHNLPCIQPSKLHKLRSKLQVAGNEQRRVINPYAPFIQEFLPKNFTVSNSYVGYFFDLIESITMFHSTERHGTNEYLFSTIEDNYQAIDIMGDIFVNMCLGIQDCGREILNHMNKCDYYAGSIAVDIQDDELMPTNGYYSVNHIMTLLKDDMGIYRDKKTTDEIMRKLVDAGYLGEKQPRKGKTPFYFKIEEVNDDTIPKPRWDEWNKSAMDWMAEYYSSDYKQWIKTQRYKYVDFHTGNTEDIGIDLPTSTDDEDDEEEI